MAHFIPLRVVHFNPIRVAHFFPLKVAHLFPIRVAHLFRYYQVEIGSMILSNFDRDLAKLSKADFRELKKVEGVGTYTACKILAAI